MKAQVYLLQWEWATMPQLVEASLLVGDQSLKWKWRWRRGSVGGFRGKGLKASTGSITIGNGRSVLRVTPHPPFIYFPRGFRVLSPWSGFQPLFWGFSPFRPNFSPFQGFSPFLRALAPRGLFWAHFWGFQPFFFILRLFQGVWVYWRVLWSDMMVVRWCPWVVQAIESYVGDFWVNRLPHDV